MADQRDLEIGRERAAGVGEQRHIAIGIQPDPDLAGPREGGISDEAEGLIAGLRGVGIDGTEVDAVKAGLEIPPRMLAAGVPAKVLRLLTEVEMRWKVEGTQVYQELSRRSHATMVATSPLTAPEPGRPRLAVSDIKPLAETRRES